MLSRNQKEANVERSTLNFSSWNTRADSGLCDLLTFISSVEEERKTRVALYKL